ncbi:MAG TPA: DUF1761 domain-containing protein [Candidatus Saccharimonadales bacterium]|nr:DUF1761 domain-containing protein [Candidatus Saccharimonadales bacterium]
MQLNYLSVIIATIVQFAIGAVWYSALFGKLWGRIHGFDKLPKETQQKMMKAMGPFYGLQALVTLITSFVLALFITYLPTWNPYAMAGFFWIGFVVPTQVSAVIFGGTESKWIVKKIAVQAGASILCLEAAAAVLHAFV